jgi:hypothetical protein
MKLNKMMFKYIGLLVICLQAFFAVAQRDQVEMAVNQPSPRLNIRLMYDKYNLIAGQSYTVKIQNLSAKNMHVKGQLVAVLICGKEVSTKFDEVIKPYETIGGEAYLFDATGMTGIVLAEDCQNFETVYDAKGMEQRNRIKTIQLRSYSSVIENTEEEKIEEQRQKQLAVERKQQEEVKKQESLNQQLKMQQDANRQQELANQQRQAQNQAQYEATMQKYQADIQRLNTIQDAAADATLAIADYFIKKQERDAAKLEQQRLEAEMDRLQKEQEAHDRKQAEDAKFEIEQKKIAEENENIALWQNKSSKIVTGKIADKVKIKKTSQITDAKIQSVYCVIWNFNPAQNQILILTPIEIKKDADGDWPLNTDIFQKIQTQTKLVVNQTPDGINTPENSLQYLLGYYTDANEALKAVEDIKTNALKNGYDIKDIEYGKIAGNKANEQKKKETTDFWKE